ncbi:AMP-dependent synthetase/ligase [Parasponia andersonii]|uniref:AMP-dependent synthetase/ligase n=1 Tax=Parasponia andersonii TaxID=3476 RepID=A0A2P5AUL6_PARAD|nr:AMP-dependent synthetase/ligase [Parasponia andersonii]
MEEPKPSPANSSLLTPLGFLVRAVTVYGNCTLVVYSDTTFTWSETHRRCLRVASAIASLGIGRGHVVSVVAPNIVTMYELQFAVPMAGAVLNNINVRLNAVTISVMLRHCESKLVFVDQLSASLVLDAVSLFPKSTPIPLLVLIADHHSEESLTVEYPDRFICNYEDPVEKGDDKFRAQTAYVSLDSAHVSRKRLELHLRDGSRRWDQRMPPEIRRSDHLQPNPTVWRYSHVRRTGGAQHAVRPNAKPLINPVNILTAGARRLRRCSAGPSQGGFAVSCAWKPNWNRLPATEQALLKARQGVRKAMMVEMDVVDPNSGISVKRDGVTMGKVVLRGGCVMLGYLKDPDATAK